MTTGGLVWIALAALTQDPAPAPEPVQDPVQEPVQEPKQEPAATPPAPAAETSEPALPKYEPRYRNSADTTLFLEALALALPDRVRRFDLANAVGGQGVSALEIAAPGPTPPKERPTVLLIGGLDGRSLAGSEAVLRIAHALAAGSDALGPDVCVIAVPFASPEALERCAAVGTSDGRDARPVDDDRDGREAEDPPDDVDEDGLILQMLVEDPNGPWTRSSDPRFLVPAKPGDAPRYLLVPEGRDDDGDGRFNEDPPGGVVLDRNFPVARDDAWRDSRCGALPLSEPITRALADLALSRRTIACVTFQGNHGGLATPGGTSELDPWLAPDAALYAECVRSFVAVTGRAQTLPRTLAEARGAPFGGAALDWFSSVVGALSLEYAVWGPQVELGADVAVRDARYEGDKPPVAQRAAPPSALDRAWAAWIDNSRGGLGFVEWHPVELEGGKRALVGGFEPWTVDTPAATSLEKVLTGSREFVQSLIAGAPKLAIDAHAERDEALVTLRATVKNLGRLPTALNAPRVLRGASGLTLEIVLPEGARLLAGPSRQEFDALVGGGTTREVRWIVQAPQGSAIALRASAPWCSSVTSEVTP